MTPGFARSRQELPWLPYPEKDRVIINAHNFTAPWTPTVNGKMPIGVWCPSRDTAGNGTTTLTDLVGGNNGTLTNFALSGSTSNWVVDTDSGGVRALDFDGTNDYVDCGIGTGNLLGTRNTFAISLWILNKSALVNDGMYYFGSFASSQGVAQLSGVGTVRYVRFNGTVYDKLGIVYDEGTWNNVVISYDGANVSVYKNGVAVPAASGAFTQNIAFGGNKLILGGYFSPLYTANIRLDDVRILNQALDSTDASDLYTALRGGQA